MTRSWITLPWVGENGDVSADVPEAGPEVEVDDTLLRYPAPIAAAYFNARNARGPLERQRALLSLFEDLVSYLALISWNEYCQFSPSSPALEAFVVEVQRPALGHRLQLLRRSIDEVRSSILGPDFLRGSQDEETCLPMSSFCQVWGAVKTELKNGTGAKRLKDAVEKHPRNQRRPRGLSLGEYFGAVVGLRNCVSHPDSYSYPYPNEDIAPWLNEYLAASLVACLGLETVRRALVDYVWVVPMPEEDLRVRFDDGGMSFVASGMAQQMPPTTFELKSAKPFEVVSCLAGLADHEPYVPFDFNDNWPKFTDDERKKLAPSPEDQILDFLRQHPGEHGRGAIENATGVTGWPFTSAIANLLEQRRIEKTGKGRGTKYRAVAESEAVAANTGPEAAALAEDEEVLGQDEDESVTEPGVSAARGGQPLRIDVGGHEVAGRTVRRFLGALVRPIRTGPHFGRLPLPFPSGSRRFLVAKEPKHPGGVPFYSPEQVGDLWVEVHHSKRDALAHAQRLVNAVGLSSDAPEPDSGAAGDGEPT